MGMTTMGVKLDEATRNKLKKAAKSVNRTPHWLIKQAIFNYLTLLDNGITLPEYAADSLNLQRNSDNLPNITTAPISPSFLTLAQDVHPQMRHRAAITAAYRQPETDLIPRLLELAHIDPGEKDAAQQLAYKLAETVREQHSITPQSQRIQDFLQTFSLSASEGVVLFCLAEAVLTIIDKAARDALIRDHISQGDWQTAFDCGASIFTHATPWALLITGEVTMTHSATQLTSSLNAVIKTHGEPVIRQAVDTVKNVLHERFIAGQFISDALANAGQQEERGFRYTYEMLSEAAKTEAEAQHNLSVWRQTIQAIGKSAYGHSIYGGPGVSIKLSTLHPRVERSQYDRVINELYPRLLELTLLARQYDMGITIDAEASHQLDIALDLLEKLCFEPQLAHWNGIGFTVQAYQKRCPYVIDYLIDLSHRSQRRLMVRLVKGGYWHSEIKQAQLEGLEGYAVYTRKEHTDIAYLACAHKLLSAPEAIYPQFATHNAYSIAAVYSLAGNRYFPGQYEFQCLYGVGEPLFEHIVGKHSEGKMDRPCRIYAPVGNHKMVFANVMQRLLENSVRSAFLSRLAAADLSLDEVIADPEKIIKKRAATEGEMGKPHPDIPLPRHALDSRRLNAYGLDLTNEQQLAAFACALIASSTWRFVAEPLIDGVALTHGNITPVFNPANCHDCVGNVRITTAEALATAMANAVNFSPIWSATPPCQRAEILNQIALHLENHRYVLIGLLVREAGKPLRNAIDEVREAVNFLRYYAELAQQDLRLETHRSLGPVACISSWRFPLANFMAQIAAALAAGNVVLAKPAEQTALIAAQAVTLMHQAGLPAGAIQLLPGDGEHVGAALVNDARLCGVLFTGSHAVAQKIQRQIAGRLDSFGHTIPFIAETGGLNALIVDASAATERVISAILSAAFMRTEHPCVSVRLLCLQDEIADRTLTQLKDAMQEYRLGNPEQLSVDIGPVIDRQAKARIDAYISTMRDKGCPVWQTASYAPGLAEHQDYSTFIAPTLIEIEQVDMLPQEIVGPVLHVIRYQRNALRELLEHISGLGYSLTMGVHSSINETIKETLQLTDANNLALHHTQWNAEVGQQSLSGLRQVNTSPKTGGPLYLYRLLSQRPENALTSLSRDDKQHHIDLQQKKLLLQPLNSLIKWALKREKTALVALCQCYAENSQVGTLRKLNGLTGEQDSYNILPRGTVLCLNSSESDALIQLAAVLASGCRALWQTNFITQALYAALPPSVQQHIECVDDWNKTDMPFNAVIFHGDSDKLQQLCQSIAKREGPMIGVQGFATGETAIFLEHLWQERAISVNTTMDAPIDLINQA